MLSLLRARDRSPPRSPRSPACRSPGSRSRRRLTCSTARCGRDGSCLGRLSDGLEAVAKFMEQSPNHRGAHLPPLLRHRSGELRLALTSPSQPRHRVAARQWVHQLFERLLESRLCLLERRTPRTGFPHSPFGVDPLLKLQPPLADGGPRQSRRRRNQRISAEANCPRLCCSPVAARALVEGSSGGPRSPNIWRRSSPPLRCRAAQPSQISS